MLIRRILAVLPLLVSLAVFAGDIDDIQQLLKNRQLPQALDRADKFIAGNPKDAQARFLKGIIQTEMGRPDEAIKTFTALTNDYPQLPEPYNNLAVLHAQQGQLDKARAALLRAIQTNPSYAIAHENLGDLYARLASQSYDKALQIENTNPNVQTKLTLVRDLFNKAPSATVAPQAVVKQNVTSQTAAPVPPTKPTVVAQTNTPAAPAKPTIQPPAAPVASTVPVAPALQPAKPQPATVAPSKPAPAPADTRETEKQKIVTAINAWADAWSRKNVNGYLAAYERDYRAPGGQKYSDWAKDRRERITAPKSISVKLSDIKVEVVDDSNAKVHLRQSYHSERLSSTTSKTLLLKKSGGHWLIHEERTGN